MSDFALQLLRDIARLGEEARQAAHAADRRRDDQKQLLAEADATAEAILNEVFRPLLEDFQAVVRSESLLRNPCIVCETADAKEKAARARRKSKALRRPTFADFDRFLTDRARRGIPAGADDPQRQMDEFERFLLAQEDERENRCEHEGEHGPEVDAGESAAQRAPAWRRLTLRGAAPDSPSVLFEVRVAAAACDDTSGGCDSGKIEFSAEILRGAACDFRRDTARALVELPRTRVAAVGTNRDAARRWCMRVLSKSAEAIMQANLPVAPAAGDERIQKSEVRSQNEESPPFELLTSDL